MKTLLLLCVMLCCATGMPAQHPYRRFTVEDGLQNDQIRQVIELPNGQMLVNTEGAFSLFNGKKFTTLSCDQERVAVLPDFGNHHYMWQGDSLLWLKDFYHLYLFDTRKGVFRYDYKMEDVTAEVRSFVEEEGTVTSAKRKEALAPHQSDFEVLAAQADLEGEVLQTFCCDRQGGQWFGTRDAGILYQSPHPKHVQLHATGEDVFRKMCTLTSDEMLVAGEKGIYVYDCGRERVAATLLKGELFANDMSRDDWGRVWISTYQGLYCYDKGELRLYNAANTKGFLYDFVRFALPLDNNRLLVCNYMHDLGLFYPETQTFECLNGELPELNHYRNMMVAAMMNNRHHIAVCTQNGFFILDVVRRRLVDASFVQRGSTNSRKYNCMLRDRSGKIWVGTQSGLLLVEGEEVLRITRADGLSNECIQSLTEDANGNVWVGTSSGINRIGADTSGGLRIRSLGRYDGIPDVEMMERGVCLMPDGTLYFATKRGLVSLPSALYHEYAMPDLPVLVGFKVAGVSFPLDTLPLKLKHRQNYIDLQCSSLNYANPGQTRYRYRLLGLDAEWQFALEDGEMMAVRYNALAPGSYTLELQASTGDNVWGPPLRKSFHIATPWWRSWWAKALYMTVSLVILYLLLVYYLKHRQELMERENEERVNRLFELREKARRQFVRSIAFNGEQLSVSADEEKLLERMMKAIGENMANTGYNVEHLAREVGMSRANLYKKMQGMLGMTPNDFIRNVRLKHAAKLLAETNIPIHQISLDVGFQTPRYFSACFRDVFGVTPSGYRNGHDVKV